MSLNEDSLHPYIITSYIPGCITTRDKTFDSSIVIFNNQVLEAWPPQQFADICDEHIIKLIDQKPDVIIIGTGSNHHPGQADWIRTAHQKHIGIEFMSTDAACRTSIALHSEGRHVLSAYLIV